jgi:50S ribosomal subunit-associated GTPase HflX
VHQIESVDKILGDLQLNKIPQIIVLNKTDLVSEDETEVLGRQIMLDKDVSVVSISANARETLRPLVEQMAVRLGSFAVSETAG